MKRQTMKVRRTTSSRDPPTHRIPSMSAASAGIDALGGLALETVISKSGAPGAAALACASSRLRAAAEDDAVWRRFLAADLGVCSPVAPDGSPCPSFKGAYKSWYESFGMYPLPLVKRAKQCLDSIKSWMAANFPEAGGTLRKGVSEAEIHQAEKALGVKVPISTKILYRLCDGQDTVTQNTSDHKRLSSLGIIGGYEFYDFSVNVHLLPLFQIVADTKDLQRRLRKSKHIMVAASFYYEKSFFLNCLNGQLYVGTKTLDSDGEVMPCVPEALLKPSHHGNNGQPDALLLWLEEHCRRLHSGMIRTRRIREAQSISLYPDAAPTCSVAVTNGVQVRASAVFVPELSDLNEEGENKYFFSYSIRMSLLPDGCMLDGTYYSSCQLLSRHWLIKSKDVIVSDVHGEAVIGKYPLLIPGQEEFVYQSCTPLSATAGSVQGSFTFVPGRLRKPEGRQFDVEVAPFVLEVPDYVF